MTRYVNIHFVATAHNNININMYVVLIYGNNFGISVHCSNEKIFKIQELIEGAEEDFKQKGKKSASYYVHSHIYYFNMTANTSTHCHLVTRN